MHDSEISNLLSQYLVEFSLSKIAYFTNQMPIKSESDGLSGYFSYICFCSSSFSEQSSFLFNKYRARFKKIPFDVFVSPVEECVTARQYNFVSLKCEDIEDAKEKASFLIQNKSRVNRNYPILVRLTIESNDFCDFIEKDGLKIECKLSSSDIVIRIDK